MHKNPTKHTPLTLATNSETQKGCVCMCVHVCACVCMCVHVCACVCAHKIETNLFILYYMNKL